MSDPVSPFSGTAFAGFATVRAVGPLGMITLRAAPGTPGLAAAVKAVTGTALPAERRIVQAGGKAAGWMSPDELLLILPYEDTDKALAKLAKTMGAAHHLAVTVSDARAVFRIEGPKADQVLRKLCPVDIDTLAPDDLRRSRAAQVACAFWRDADGFTLVSFRSVAEYMMRLLCHAAQSGGELDLLP
jgi:sarcosine oxidase, subunit gamma